MTNDDNHSTPVPARPGLRLVLAVACAIAVFFWPAFVFTMFSDDLVYIFRNPVLQASPAWRLLTERVNEFEFLPLRDLDYWLDWTLFGAQTLPYHLHNLVWYFGTCVATWFAATNLQRLHAPDTRAMALVPLVAAVLFTLHPLHVEPVIWISGRKDLMAGFFVLLATGFWARGLAGGRTRTCWIAIALYILAIFSKLPVVVFPAIAVPMWLAWTRNRCRPGQVVLPVTLCAVGAAAAALALTVGADTSIVAESRLATGIVERVQLAVRILGFATWKILAPTDLRLVYDFLFAKYTPGWHPADVAGIGMVVLTIGALWIYVRRRSLWALAVLWFTVFMTPYLQLVPFAAVAPFSDRFAFTASFGPAVLAGIAVASLRGVRIGRLALIASAAALGALTLVRGADWASTETLLTRESRLAAGSLAPQLMVIEDVYLPARRYEEALSAAARIGDPALRSLTGLRIRNAALEQGGDVDAWRAFLRAAMARHAEILDGDVSLAITIAAGGLKTGLNAEVEQFYRAMRASPAIPRATQADVVHNLALAVERQGRLAEALELYREAADSAVRGRQKRAAAWNSIGAVENRLGNPLAAEHAFRNALELDPDYEFAAVNLASLYSRTGRDADLARLLGGPAGRLPLVAERFPRP